MPPNDPWRVVSPFPVEEGDFLSLFVELLREVSDERLVRAKRQLKCLRSYLAELRPGSAVVEYRYVSRDYLEDYAAYYARCHYPYPRDCIRVHFFRDALDDGEFRRLVALGNGADARMESHKDGYLGFVVLRPLPHTFVGTTCLLPYDKLDGQRHCAKRPYDVNLFGIRLGVESVAFQEQDRAVAVCATAALWCALQQTSSLWEHAVPSPAAITDAASEVPRRSRALPSEGLTAEQMARVIQRIGLEPQAYEIRGKAFLRSVAYAYLRCGIPLLLGESHWYWKDKMSDPEIGKHAVAITGMRLETGGPLRRFSSDRVGRLFLHDDQAVPFARADIDPRHPVDDVNANTAFSKLMATPVGHPWYAKPEFVIVPLYSKIRISLIPIKKAIVQLDAAVHALLRTKRQLVEWDVRLVGIADFRDYLHAHMKDEGTRRDLLCRSLPRYMWQATALVEVGVPAIDFLFDATDIGQQRLFLTPVVYDRNAAQLITLPMKPPRIRDLISDPESLLWQMCAAVEREFGPAR